MKQQVLDLYASWLKFGCNNEQTVRLLNGLFEVAKDYWKEDMEKILAEVFEASKRKSEIDPEQILPSIY